MKKMRRLLMIRHAEAELGLGQPDFKRALTQRGVKQARHCADWISNQQLEIDCIVSSPAVRTCMTTDIICQHLALDQDKISYHQQLYNADPVTVQQIVEKSSQCNTLMVIGHNPGLSSLLNNIIDHPAQYILTPASAAIVVIKENIFHTEHFLDAFYPAMASLTAMYRSAA